MRFARRLGRSGAVACVMLCFGMRMASAQSSPPGLGVAHTATWLALGLRQHLDTLERQQWVAYVGVGRKSDPTDYLPYHRPAIIVLNQEYYHRVRRHWQYALAVSYREQDEYRAVAPFEHGDPRMRQEFRVYGRWSWLLKRHRWKFAATLRQELRLFYTPDFMPWEEDLQLRTRFRMQVAWDLNTARTVSLSASAEPLFATSRATSGACDWSPLAYGESRFGLFLSWRLQPLVLSVGYMNNLLDDALPHDVHYVSMCAVWEDPFAWGRRSRSTDQP